MLNEKRNKFLVLLKKQALQFNEKSKATFKIQAFGRVFKLGLFLHKTPIIYRVKISII